MQLQMHRVVKMEWAVNDFPGVAGDQFSTVTLTLTNEGGQKFDVVAFVSGTPEDARKIIPSGP